MGTTVFSHTYTLDAQTMTHGKTLAQGENVIVVTLNNASTATHRQFPFGNPQA